MLRMWRLIGVEGRLDCLSALIKDWLGSCVAFVVVF